MIMARTKTKEIPKAKVRTFVNGVERPLTEEEKLILTIRLGAGFGYKPKNMTDEEIQQLEDNYRRKKEAEQNKSGEETPIC